MLEDNAIIELYNERDEKAIQETANKYGKLLYSISYNIVVNPQDAEECTSDTYLNVWNSIPPKRPHSFKAYILKVVRNISINRLKLSRRKKRGNGEYQIALEEIENTLSVSNERNFIDGIYLRDTLNCFLDTLSNEKREIFIRRYWYFDSIKDISKNYGVGTSKVKMVLLRCRNELKDYLIGEGFLL